jgi:hypothetical protein
MVDTRAVRGEFLRVLGLEDVSEFSILERDRGRRVG